MQIEHNKRYLVTGGAGFIGSHLVARLRAEGCAVTVFDNFSVNTQHARARLTASGVEIVEGDLANRELLGSVVARADVVFHFGAYSATQQSSQDPGMDLRNNTLGTWNVLEAMREHAVGRLVFLSSQLVFGAVTDHVSESSGPLLPSSLFGASKLACEGLISAYSHLYEMEATICRLGNIVGGGMSRGIIFDVLRKLQASPVLRLLGDGRQTRGYLLIDDCIDAILTAFATPTPVRCRLYHVANDDVVTALQVARCIAEELGMARRVEILTEASSDGWKGDVPRLVLDISRLSKLGWSPTRGSDAAVRETVRRLIAQQA